MYVDCNKSGEYWKEYTGRQSFSARILSRIDSWTKKYHIPFGLNELVATSDITGSDRQLHISLT